MRRDRTDLYCVRCSRRKAREEFREMPWHGRAAACRFCEDADRYLAFTARQSWQLQQEREKNRALRRARGTGTVAVYRAEVRRLQDYIEHREYLHAWPSDREIPADVDREVKRQTAGLEMSLRAVIGQLRAGAVRRATRNAEVNARLTAIESIACALEDALNGDSWYAAHAIRRLAAGDITPDEALRVLCALP
ncbi:hypothetical protein [Kitasatospora sp. NPDC050543]|uniref:hypothetical protein n=1 Tax=Kitasatospora sp. NPDC050543 TaxID=3364054 RepID=UPI00378DF351